MIMSKKISSEARMCVSEARMYVSETRMYVSEASKPPAGARISKGPVGPLKF